MTEPLKVSETKYPTGLLEQELERLQQHRISGELHGWERPSLGAIRYQMSLLEGLLKQLIEERKKTDS